MKKPYQLGIALAGGGARGIAHIGVLQALNEHNIFPECLSGTSAGSIISAMYAAGVSPVKMLEIIKKNNSIFKVVRFGFPSVGLSKLTRLKEILEEYIPENSFSSLQYPLHIAVTNLETGQLELRSMGELHQVVVASCSIPIIFNPAKIGRELYVDGGLIMNLPVSPIRPLCEHVIGVDVMPNVPVSQDNLDGIRGIGMRCFHIAIAANSAPEVIQCDVVIEPNNITDYTIMDLHRAQDLFNAGYEATIEKLPEIRAMLKIKSDE